MEEKRKFRGTLIQRLFIFAMSIILAVLLFWLLGFITKDIGSLKGPDFSAIRKKHVNAELEQKSQSLNSDLDRTKGSIHNKQQQQVILKDGTDNLQNTINQLLSIQKLNVERRAGFPAEQQQTLTDSQSMFLENQRQYQALSKEIAELTLQQQELEEELASVSKTIRGQTTQAQAEYRQLLSRHRLKIAALKLAVMIPIFVICALLFTKKRSGTYGPIVYATFLAIFARISIIVHEYFPRKYFKYIAMLVVIAIVLRLLVYVIKRIIAPKKDLIIRQNQEAYDKGVCPVCGKPIRIGPLRFAVSNKRRSVIVVPVKHQAEASIQEIYTCPSCGTELYEKCDKCGDIRHSLLPFCEHCGNEKSSAPE